MTVLAECPICRNKQSLKNKKCKCGEDLDQAKRSNRVKYYIDYRIPGGKHCREYVSYSVEEARDADGKRRVQKREGRIFDMLPQSKMTFEELTKWYLNQSKVKKLKSYDRIKLALKNFNAVLGKYRLNNIKQTDLEEYQIKREEQGRAHATIDMEIKIAQTAVTKACDNDESNIDYSCLKAFRKTDRLLKRGSNVRKTTLSIEQYLKLLKHASPHYRAVLIIAYNTGMRLGEIKALKWQYVDKNFLRLPKDIVKENDFKNIPVNHYVKTALEGLPRALHNDYVITYQGVSLSKKFSLKKQFSDTCKKAKIPYGRKILNGITFHDIRRTVKTNMAAAGVSKVYRDTILGHSLKGMDIHYIMPSDDDLIRAINQYTNWIDEKMFPAFVDQTVDQKTQRK